MTTLLGVDAGGSRTRAVVADGSGQELARGEGGPGAMRVVGAATSATAIQWACKEALQRARLEAPVGVLVVGAAGAGREPERTELERALVAMNLAATVVVTTDAELALAAAFGEGPGIVLLAGTGSVAWARLPDGSTARAGGLGSLLGDQGSGYDLALSGLRSAALAAQGFGNATALTQKLFAQIGVELEHLPQWAAQASAADVAALAPLVLDAAQSGDAVARKIVEAGADVLARHARALAHKFSKNGKVAIAFGGGLLQHRNDYRQLVAGRVGLLVPNVEPRGEPVDGLKGAIEIAKGR